MRLRTRLASALALVGALLSTACVPERSAPSVDTRTAAPPSAGSVAGELTVAEVVTGLTTPWDLQPLQDGSFLVAERDTGKILRVSGTMVSELTTLPGVVPGGEGGLLGLALTGNERGVFAYFTSADDNRIVGMTWDGSRLGTPRLLLSGIPKGGRHNGGGLALGPDGYLYVGTGDASQAGLAQDRESLGGKILRIQGDGRPARDNPFDTAIWSWGHRNVQGLAFDEAGRLWASEFGEQDWDELNLITRGGNYGWPEVEGSGDVPDFTNPKVVWRTSEASPSGLAYWGGSLWMAALRGERLWQIPLSGSNPGDPEPHVVGRYGRLRAVTVDSGGDSLLLSTSNTDGRGDEQEGDDRILRLTLSG
jgi:glucose/arabinose dehydrogenase